MSLVPIERKPVKKSRNATVTPIFKSADPYFNEGAAKRAYEAIMKLDDDSAFMVTNLLMKDVLADDIEANQRTLQRHINNIVEKRISRLRKATMNAVSKSRSQEAVEFSKALDAIEKAYKNPYLTGHYQFNEHDFRRDPTTGQFRTKVVVNPRMDPLGEKQAKNLGIPLTEKYKNLSPGRKSQFQQEWLQIANFLNAAQETTAKEGGLGSHDVELNVQDEHGGRYVRQVNGKPRMGIDWDPEVGERVVGVSVSPGGLRLGGVAFGLGNALGSAPKTSTVGAVNRFDEGFKNFQEDWTNTVPEADKNSNARLYSRVESGAKFLSDVAPDTAIKTQMAARFARAVGEHGPQAEKILGPGIRRLMYRYRGTEKTPDASAVNEYRIATKEEAGQLTPEQNKQLDRYLNGRVNRYRKNKATNQNIPEDAIKLNADEISQVRRSAERKWREDRNLLPQDIGLSEEARTGGRVALARWLMDKDKNAKLPRRDLYHLQMEAGNTPASTGFIIDASGQIVTQAQGYGDDHYVPFNLKNLKGLKGGEYIRSRSVGGPTAEDIYTGLATGARRVTVVSRSGYFTVEFNPETTQGFFNDKAKRMVSRYENILDAVQSEQIDRPVHVDPEVQRFFGQRVQELYPAAGPRLKHQYTKKMIDEYKSTLQMTEGDNAEFEVYLAEQTEGLSEDRARVVRAQMMNNWRSDNEYRFRLNGRGYQDALRSLEEQFPYYINTSAGPLKELAEFAGEHDKGYVEPGRNRPTEAKAGLFGTAQRLGPYGNATAGKFSASQADYQGYFMPKRERGPQGQTPAAPEAPTSTPTDPGTQLASLREERSIEATREAKQREVKSVQEKGLALTKALQEGNWEDAGGLEAAGKILPPLAMKNDEAILDYFSKPENIRRADEALKSLDVSGALTDKQRSAMKDYAEASGRLNRVPFDKKLMFQVPDHPFRFEEAPYLDGADPSMAEGEAARIDQQTKPVSHGGVGYSTMSQDELENELNVLFRIHRGLDSINQKYDEDDLPGRTKELEDLGVNVSIPGVMQILERNNLDQHAENVQRMMALNLNRGKIVPRTLELPAIETTQHASPPSPSNLETATKHAQDLQKGLDALASDIDWTLDTPERRVASALGSRRKAFSDASKGSELSDDQLKSLVDASQAELQLAYALASGRGDRGEMLRRYIDRDRF